MNRREAIAALTALPGLASIQTADLKPNDVLVCRCDGHISEDLAVHLRETLERVFPGRKILVLSDGLSLEVLRDGPPTPPKGENPGRIVRDGGMK